MYFDAVGERRLGICAGENGNGEVGVVEKGVEDVFADVAAGADYDDFFESGHGYLVGTKRTDDI